MKIHGKEYTEVKDRIPLLLEKYPRASIKTDVRWNSPDFDRVVIQATVETGEGSVFTGFAYEERVEGATQVNATSWVENAETSAIGRALANMNIGVNGARPSAEEMQKVERMKDSTLVQRIEAAIKKATSPEEMEKIQAGMKKKFESGELTEEAYIGLIQKHFTGKA